MTPIQAVKGMSDILPPESARWEWLEARIRALCARCGYANLRPPIVEPTVLFARGLGAATDIVEKEMYSFEDALNGDRLSLRPEATAGIVRAAIEHSLLRDGGKRLYCIGPMFRHERPQRGRSRQFHQFDAEAMGYAGPDVDAELILMLRALWRDLGFVEGRDVRLEINSLGQPAERSAHRAALIAHLEAHAALLDDDAKRRLHTNPLRILDSKHAALQPAIEAAPRLIDFLGAESLAHFAALRAALDQARLDYRINPRLVRGLDYYNLTVFEWVTDRLGAQGTLAGGGRYDGLFELLGGKPAPAVGFGLGMERVLLLAAELGVDAPGDVLHAYAIVPGAAQSTHALTAIEELRAAGVAVAMNAGFGSMKSQFKRADSSGARFALVFGESEVAAGQVAVKALRDPDAPQTLHRLDAVCTWAGMLRTG